MSLTLDAASAVGVTLSNGNLTATNTGTTSTNQGAKVLSAKTSGDNYYEFTVTTKNTTPGNDFGAGVAVDSDSFTDAGFNVTNATVLYIATGNIWANGSNTGLSLGPIAQGTTIGVLASRNHSHVWFRVCPSGNWNGQSSSLQNPVGNVGGAPLSTSAGNEPYFLFGGTNGTSGNALTGNWGASAFSGAIPTGAVSWDGSQSAIAVVLPPALLQNRIAL